MQQYSPNWYCLPVCAEHWGMLSEICKVQLWFKVYHMCFVINFCDEVVSFMWNTAQYYKSKFMFILRLTSLLCVVPKGWGGGLAERGIEEAS